MQRFYNEQARHKLLTGAKLIHDAVTTTLGSKGLNAMIKRQYGPLHVTHDGYTVAKNFKLADEEVALGYQAGVDLMLSAAIAVNEKAGNGTTSVVALAYSILEGID